MGRGRKKERKKEKERESEGDEERERAAKGALPSSRSKQGLVTPISLFILQTLSKVGKGALQWFRWSSGNLWQQSYSPPSLPFLFSSLLCHCDHVRPCSASLHHLFLPSSLSLSFLLSHSPSPPPPLCQFGPSTEQHGGVSNHVTG